MQMGELKVCTGCKTAKERTDFYKQPRVKDGLRSRCKSCFKAYKEAHADEVRAYSAEHSDKLKARTKAWIEAHPDRHAASLAKDAALRRGASVSDIYDLELCTPFYAESRRLTRETGVPHHVDHIIPIAKGGLHCQTNLQVLTARENQEKGDSL